MALSYSSAEDNHSDDDDDDDEHYLYDQHKSRPLHVSTDDLVGLEFAMVDTGRVHPQEPLSPCLSLSSPLPLEGFLLQDNSIPYPE